MNSDQDQPLEFLHKKLNQRLEEQATSYKGFVYAKKNGFYQGFDEIKIDGCRPTEKRFERYSIGKYLSQNKTALDIGCNCGFFTIYITKFLKHVDGVELNSHLIDIANDTKEFLKKNNVDFFASSFENFVAGKKYDIIFSLANDETIDGNTKFTFVEYIEKILNLLTKDGYIMFETVSTDTFEPRIFTPKLKFLQQHFEVIEDKMVKSEYPINVPERRFLVLKRL